ncbi:hypothetical protein CROQUDRAFT_669105 [Cronartium quercuum f. sp. fusiforme G11]|uniref:Ubiquitin-conjugating enzyme E2 6 n=1 Tax=Cronartium quercuum f. sp. fusiforme G11 TaxID=708437 RepID=A0A9P6NQ21_9BASI|nr:hypothetical protein CROQUDRAFT_669105 [Cronartium quercuum f. sp. fusiforme G11]
MASKQAHKRLMKEHADLSKAPPPFIYARPKESDILEWHYIIRGPPDTPYEGGEFWGTVIFPADYPFKPPGIKMLTPSGRFQPDRKICTSMSDYHPGSWNPAWSVATILTGLLSFMVGDEMTTGSVRSSDADRRIYAKRSHAYNILQPKFRALFPEYLDPNQAVDLPNMGDTPPKPASDVQPPPVPSTTESTGGTSPASTAQRANNAIEGLGVKVQQRQSQLETTSRPVLKAVVAALGLWMVLSWWVS